MRDRDWYFRKIGKFHQKLFDDLANAERPTKKDERNNHKLKEKERQHALKIADWVDNCANYLFQGDLGIVCGRRGDTIIFFDNERESVYQRINCTELDDEDSIFGGLRHSMAFADKFTEQVHHKGKRVNVPSPYWVQEYNKSYGQHWDKPSLNFFNGGPVDKGSWRKFDTVYAILARNEFVVTQKAVRGIGKGSYALGSQILYLLMKQFEREARNYAHRR